MTPPKQMGRRKAGGRFILGRTECLFRGDLAWRIERAGIVDFGDLMVGEAQHLTQDLIGVFAEER